MSLLLFLLPLASALLLAMAPARYLPRLQRALERLLAKSDPHLVIETLAGSARRLVGEAKVALARAPRKHREEDGIPLPAWDREE